MVVWSNLISYIPGEIRYLEKSQGSMLNTGLSRLDLTVAG